MFDSVVAKGQMSSCEEIFFFHLLAYPSDRRMAVLVEFVEDLTQSQGQWNTYRSLYWTGSVTFSFVK